MKKPNEPLKELPRILVAQNIYMSGGVAATVALLPIFIWNVTKTQRHGRGLNMPRAITIFNPLNGTSCSNITDVACWQYGIPTHMMWLFWELRNGNVGLSYTFMVPDSQHFYTDMILRQQSKHLPFCVDSSVVYNDAGVPSSRYALKDYKPQGVKASNKSADMMLGHLLFSNFLTTKVNVSKDQKKVTTKKEHVVPEIKNSKPRNPKSKSPTTQNRKQDAKLGRNYK